VYVIGCWLDVTLSFVFSFVIDSLYIPMIPAG
jgi:hypothetical protein